MKFITFILAVIALILSCVPCSDVKANPYNQNFQSSNSSSKEKKHNDSCTPFFTCSCCAGFSINYTVPKIEKLSASYNIDYIQCFNSAAIKISLPIWQPPQL